MVVSKSMLMPGTKARIACEIVLLLPPDEIHKFFPKPRSAFVLSLKMFQRTRGAHKHPKVGAAPLHTCFI